MAEGIVISVGDNVSTGPAAKIRAIGTEARDAHRYVELLRSELGRMASAINPVAALQAQLQRTQTATARLSAAQAQAAITQQRLSTAQTQGQTAAQRLQAAQTGAATATQRLSTAQAQTATATAQAAAAQSRAAQAALQHAQAQQRAVTATTASANATVSFLRQLIGVATIIAATRAVIGLADSYTTLENKLGTVSTSIAQTNELKREVFALAQRASIGVGETTSAFTRFDRALEPLGKSQAEVLRMTETISKALQVGGATTQEAAGALLQLSQGFNAGRLQGEEFRSVAENMPSFIKALATVMKVGTGEVKELGSQGKITSEKMFEATKLMERSTDEAFSKMDKTIGQATTNAKNSLTFMVGALDEATGFSRTLSGALMELSSMMDSASAAFAAGDSQVLQYIKGIGELLGLMVSFAGGVLSDLIGGIRTLTGETSATSNGMWLLETALKAVIVVFQTVLIVGSDIVFIFRSIYMEAKAAIEQIVALLSFDWGKVTGIKEALDKDSAAAYDSLLAFQKKVNLTPKSVVDVQYDKYEARRNASRATPAAMALRQSGRNTVKPSLSKEEENAIEKRATAMAKINAELNNELSRMTMLKPLRDDQAKFDQIQEGLISKKITLTKSEANAIKERIKQIREGLPIQQEMDRVYEDAIAPQRNYSASLQAINNLWERGEISLEQYNREMYKAKESYEDAINPLRQFNTELANQIKLAGMRPLEQQIATNLEAAKKSKGAPLSTDEITRYTEETRLLDAKNRAQAVENQLLDASVGSRQTLIMQLTKIKELAASGKEGFTQGDATMATNDLLKSFGIDTSTLQIGIDAEMEMLERRATMIQETLGKTVGYERDAAFAITQIRMQQQNLQLQSTEDFLGRVAGLSQTHGKKLAAVGKAAAIAQALITTYKNAVLAYSAGLQAGGPFGPALGTAYAAIAVAMGMAQVAQIRSQGAGFMSGGYTGDVGRSQVAGVVHGQEFVMNAQATKRIGVPTLTAIQNGAAAVKANSAIGPGGVKVDVKIENYGTSKSFDVEENEGRIRIIARDEARTAVHRHAPEVVAADIARSPNSSTSKALRNHTQTQRKM